jgi:hypothetical protein
MRPAARAVAARDARKVAGGPAAKVSPLLAGFAVRGVARGLMPASLDAGSTPVRADRGACQFIGRTARWSLKTSLARSADFRAGGSKKCGAWHQRLVERAAGKATRGARRSRKRTLAELDAREARNGVLGGEWIMAPDACGVRGGESGALCVPLAETEVCGVRCSGNTMFGRHAVMTLAARRAGRESRPSWGTLVARHEARASRSMRIERFAERDDRGLPCSRR